MNGDLLVVIQEHVDAAYAPPGDVSSDGIDWVFVEKSAHEHLDTFVAYEAVQKAIEFF